MSRHAILPPLHRSSTIRRYEAYGNYVATSLTSIKGVFGAVKTKARSVVGLVAGPAPIAVEPDPVYDAEVAHVEELVGPVSG